MTPETQAAFGDAFNAAGCSAIGAVFGLVLGQFLEAGLTPEEIGQHFAELAQHHQDSMWTPEGIRLQAATEQACARQRDALENPEEN